MGDAEGATALGERVKAMWEELDRSPQHRSERERRAQAAGQQHP
jgi:hypothetical protein